MRCCSYIDHAAQIKKILGVEKPYSFIPKLEEYDRKLMEEIAELLENDARRIEPDVYADWKMAKESIPSDRPYAEGLIGSFDLKFSDLVRKLNMVNDVAALNGIPSESNALLQNCLYTIQNEEDAYQSEVERKRKEEEEKGKQEGTEPVVTVKPVKVIKNKPVSFRNFAIEVRKILMKSAITEAGFYGITKDGCKSPTQKG